MKYWQDIITIFSVCVTRHTTIDKLCCNKGNKVAFGI